MKDPDSHKSRRLFEISNNPERTIRQQLLLNRRAAQRSRRKRTTKLHFLSGMILGIISTGIATILVLIGFISAQILADLPDIHKLRSMAGPGGNLYTPVLLYDRTGQYILSGIPAANSGREFISIPLNGNDQPPAVLASYSEVLLGNEYRNTVKDTISSPGSTQPITIADRLVSDLLLSSESPSLNRTIRTKLLAAQATAIFGKPTLLEWYLNTASYGHASYGFEQASQNYFQKNNSQLNPGEILILAVALQDPSINPVDTPDSFDISLQEASSFLMTRGLVNMDVLDQASRAVATLKPPLNTDNEITPTFSRYVLEQLSDAMGRATVERGGVNITTSMDYELQTGLECTVFALEKAEPSSPECDRISTEISIPMPGQQMPDGLWVNFVVLDPSNGQVLAMMGDYSPKTGQQDYLLAHPTGSLLTPFIYLSGMLRGMGPATLVWDTPTNLDNKLIETHLSNYEYQGPMRLRVALSEDRLVPASKALASFGLENVVDVITGFGIQLYAVEGIPFDSGVTDSLSIAQAFGIFANEGNKAGHSMGVKGGRLIPTMVLNVRSNDDSLLMDWEIPEQQAVISDAMAFMMNDMLASGDLEEGSYSGSTRQGATSSGSDFIRVAYTHNYVLVTWMGYTDPVGKRPLNSLGIDTALVNVLEAYYREQVRTDEWKAPEGVVKVTVCDPSGLLPGEACPQTVKEYFLVGNEPTEIDTLFKQYPIDIETGRLATVFTDPTRLKQHIFFNPPPDEINWARQAGYSLPPDTYAVFQVEEPSAKISIENPQDFISIRGKLNIEGTFSPEGFISYRLDLGGGLAPSRWLQIGDTRSEIPSEKEIGSLDTTRYKDGLYTLRIQVLREGNLVDNAYVVILIKNES